MATYIRTFATTCHGDLLEAINADGDITPECVQLVDTDDGNITFHFDATLSAGEETALDVLLAGWSCPVKPDNISALVFVDERVFGPEETKIIDLPQEYPHSVVHVMDPYVDELINSTLVSPAGTGWDPLKVSTVITSINNGVYADLVYNNSVSGNTTGVILGIDMGAPTTIRAMKRWDYSPTYYDTEWQFIGTNDSTGATYNVIFTHKQNTAYLDPHPFYLVFSPQTYRYFGVRCVKSFSSSYSIIRELELYTGTVAQVERKLMGDVEYSYRMITPSQIQLTNLTLHERTLKTIIMGTN